MCNIVQTDELHSMCCLLLRISDCPHIDEISLNCGIYTTSSINSNHLSFVSYCIGILALNVTKDIYEELGIEGKPSQFCSKTRMKYVIHIDVTKSCFRPGKKNYDRLKWCFTDRLDLEFNFLVAWLPNGTFIACSNYCNVA